MNDPHSHARIDRLRDEISGIDRAILDAVNARLALVAELKRYKEEHGIPFLDPDRERQLLDELVAANAGPLSESGLREVFRQLLEVVKREVSRDGAAGG
jgi:3-deoxy-7-phosphoheptulonate synthase / chorismate mutase